MKKQSPKITETQVEVIFHIRKHTMSEYHLIKTEIQGDQVVKSEILRKDLPSIVVAKLQELLGNQFSK